MHWSRFSTLQLVSRNRVCNSFPKMMQLRLHRPMDWLDYHLASSKVFSKIELNLLRIPLYWKFFKSLWLVLNRMVRTSLRLLTAMLMVFWSRTMFCGIGVRLDLDLKPMPLRGHGGFRAVKSFMTSPSMGRMVLLRMTTASCMEILRMMKKQSISLTIKRWLQFRPHQANGLPYKEAMLRAYGLVMSSRMNRGNTRFFSTYRRQSSIGNCNRMRCHCICELRGFSKSRITNVPSMKCRACLSRSMHKNGPLQKPLPLVYVLVQVSITMQHMRGASKRRVSSNAPLLMVPSNRFDCRFFRMLEDSEHFRRCSSPWMVMHQR